jgi:hypothetical protein
VAISEFVRDYFLLNKTCNRFTNGCQTVADLSVGSSLAAVWKTVTQTATISLAAV